MDPPPPLPSGPDTGPPSPPPLPRPVLPLDYGGTSTRPRRLGPFLLRILGGFFAYLAVSVGWFALGINLRVKPGMIWSAWLAMTAALLALALHLRTRYNKPGYGYGILLALFLGFLLVVGLVLLIIGMCFR